MNKRKSIKITGEAHDHMMEHFLWLTLNAQKKVGYTVKPPSISTWVPEAIIEKMARDSQD